MNAGVLSKIGRLALDLLYPPVCALCGRSGSFLCEACAESLPAADGPRCRSCWLPVSRPDGCPRCAARPLSLAAIRSPYRYEGAARELVHCFKFRDVSALAPAMSTPMASTVDWPVDIISPVPLSKSRERERGYNQSRLLAQAIAVALGVPPIDTLRRPRSGPPQARSASAEARRRNVLGAFEVRDAAAVTGRNVLLVDDVVTTGATLEACARALRRAGAAEVTAVTFARED